MGLGAGAPGADLAVIQWPRAALWELLIFLQ